MSRHKSEKLFRPCLFQMNIISHAEKVESLSFLLDNDHTENQATIANLPSNIDVIKVLNVNLEILVDNSSNSNAVNELCVLIWWTYNKYEWFIGYLKSMGGEDFCIPTKKSFHHSGGIPVEFHWSHGKLLENDWNKWNLWNSSEIPLEFQQFIILTPLKFHLSKIFVENWR